VVVSEQRVSSILDLCDRVVSLDGGVIAYDGVPRAFDRPAPLRPLEPSRQPVRGEAVARLDGIGFRYGTAAPVLADTSMTARRGEVVALVGPNGSGKTTLAKIAAGLLEPDSGARTVVGRATYLSQDPGRYLACERCDDEVALGARSPAAAARAVEHVALSGYESRHPRDLSSGERERLALAAVLATEPDLLVLDEPTRGVDPAARARLADVIRADARDRATVLVTHDLDLVAALADRTISLGREGALRAA
jgi:energy-coupling factor transport system ATP-binding protein